MSVKQQVLEKVPQGREFARDRSAIDSVREKVFHESANIFAFGRCECALTLGEKLGELSEISCVRLDGQSSEPLLYPEIVEESGKSTLIGVGRGHEPSMRVIGRSENDEVGSAEGYAARLLLSRF